MKQIIQDAIESVIYWNERLTEAMFDKHNQTEDMFPTFLLETDGTLAQIRYNEKIIWNSEDDGRTTDDNTGEYNESLDDFIHRQIHEMFAILELVKNELL